MRSSEDELIFGEYEYIKLKAKDLTVLSQVRKTKNSKMEELIDSIRDKGLINPIDIARLSPEEFQSHLNFINRLWKKNDQIESFPLIDGFYYVVIAGHSRTLSIKEIEKLENTECYVFCKIHKARSSEEIIAIQLDENIHSEVRIEERAIAIIESYYLGIEDGRWKNREEFIKQNKHKYSRRVLNDAVDFSYAPIRVQEFIFKHNISYAVGVELGRIYPLVEKFETARSLEEDVQKNIRTRYDIIIGYMQGAGSIKRSLQILAGQIQMMSDYFRPKDQVQLELDGLWESYAEQAAKEYTKALERERNTLVAQLTSSKFNAYRDYLQLSGGLSDSDVALEVSAVNTLQNQYVKERLG